MQKYESSLKALSPTSLKCFEESVDTFVCRYVLEVPRPPQTKPMSIGSAFDARIKAYIAQKILGINDWFEKLFEIQVEPAFRDWAFVESEKVFQGYVSAGCADTLIQEIGDSISLRLEFEQFKSLRYEDGFEVPLYGKPDAYFMRRDGLQIVVDWKVNGYCSQASPAPGYVRLYDAEGFDLGAYKFAFPMQYKGILCTTGEVAPQWRDQMRMYTWMLGEDNNDWIAGIDQLVFRNGTPRYAIHRLRIAEDDPKLRERIRFAWECISNGHYFYDRSFEESNMRIEMLKNNKAMVDCLLNFR